jgi:hypothetical protein
MAVSFMSFCNGHCDNKLLKDGVSTYFHSFSKNCNNLIHLAIRL